MIALRLLWGIVSWVGFYVLIDLPLFIIGLPIVAALAYTQQWQWVSTGKDDIGAKFGHQWEWPRTFWLWGNDEDGVLADPLYRMKKQREGWSLSHIAFVWSGLRNSANNLRFVPGLTCIVRPSKVRYKIFSGPKAGQSTGSYLVWQGLYTRLEWTTKWFWLGIGWKIRPSDWVDMSDGEDRLPRDDWRRAGAGFGLRLKKLT